MGGGRSWVDSWWYNSRVGAISASPRRAAYVTHVEGGVSKYWWILRVNDQYYANLIVNIPAIATRGLFSSLRIRLVSRLLFYLISILNKILLLVAALAGGIYNGRALEF